MSKFCSALLLSIILILVESRIFCLAKNMSFNCVAVERKALLKFKGSFIDPSNRLSSWKDDTNCCMWGGVSCDNNTGHVIKLDLKNNNSFVVNMSLQSRSLDSSLLELKHLTYLDVSGNDFQLSPIPAFLGSMKQLQHLILSNANFYGIIPHNLGNLSNLHTLYLNSHYQYFNFPSQLMVDDFTWISNLSSLEFLELSHVKFNPAKDLARALTMLPSLVLLGLSSSGLDNNHLPHACVNSTLFLHIEYLDLSENFFSGEFPCFLKNMTSLRFLDLSSNHYNSSSPHFLRSRELVYFNLASNQLQQEVGWISKFISDKCYLELLILPYNHFHGDISGAFKNFSGCWSHNLEELNLAGNDFNGHLPKELGNLNKLVYLDLSFSRINGSIPASIRKLSALKWLNFYGNVLSGPIPESIGDLKMLTSLDLGSNRLSGEIPISLGQLSNLEEITISNNSFSGALLEAHFAMLANLQRLEATSIEFLVGDEWVPPFQLKRIDISSSNVGGHFPQWLQTQKTLTHLDISNCSISGTLPEWLGEINTTYLDISNNRIYGTIPSLSSNMLFLDLSRNLINHLPSNIGHMLPSLESLRLSGNSINGSLPTSLCNMKDLRIIDLSKNYLSGNIPECWQNFQYLTDVVLSFNNLLGLIPKSFGGACLPFYNISGIIPECFCSLSLLRLNNNRFVGQIPSALKNCTYLRILDVGGNNLVGTIPEWIGNYKFGLKILRLRDNQFHGVIPSALCQASRLQIIDLGNNKLTGRIPRCFGNFSGMISSLPNYIVQPPPGDHTVSYDSITEVLKGLELEYTSILRYLTNLDLSGNELVGTIPSEITHLVGLRGLNMSFNHLKGEIPTMIGRLRLLESLDLSNNNLVGRIPDSLSNLNSLSHLNLSNNDLSGQIPTGHQLQTLNDPSSYDGNPLLCGAPLLKKCHSDEAPKGFDADNHTATNEDTIDKICFSAFVIGGFTAGLWGFIGILVFKKKWRHVYFGFIDAGIGKMLGH